MTDSIDRPPKRSTARDLVGAAAEGGAGMVPVVGAPLGVAFAYALNFTFNRRMDAWLEDVAEAIQDLQQDAESVLTFEELASDDGFVDAVVAATRAAQATHLDGKLSALRNGVLNSLPGNHFAADERARFFRLVDELTPAHIKLLDFFRSPGQWYRSRGMTNMPMYMTASRSQLLEDSITEFRGQRDWYELLAQDLQRAGLADLQLFGMMTGHGVWDPNIRPLGERLLRFIADPV